MITFNADEVFEMAEQIERDGAKFYRKAAKSADGDSRDLMLRLAAMEDDHEKVFADMRAELVGLDKRSFTADPDHEAALYLQAVVKGEVFGSDPSDALSGDQTMEEILAIAVSLEKESIVFYQSMKDVVPNKAGAERLDAIIRQELGHIVDLRQQLKALKH